MGRATPSESARTARVLVIPGAVVVIVVIALLAKTALSAAAAYMNVAFGFAGVLFIVMLLTGLRWLQPRTVSIVLRGGRMVFSPPSLLQITISLAAGLALLSIAHLWADPAQWTSLPFNQRGGIMGGPLVGVIMVAEALWSLRRAPGLSVDEHGLRGVRGGPRVALAWADVIDVKVVEAKKRRLLMLVLASGGGMELIPEGAVSGDVYAVATVLNFYLQNPGERGRLTDGLEAIRHVDAEVLARRFSTS